MRLPPWPLLLAFEEDDLLKSLLFGKKRDLDEGRSYLVEERKPARALAHFQRAIEQGYRPLYITRQHPNHVVRHNLNSLSNLISNFVADGDRAVVLLDGIEYLMMNNDFPRLLQFLEYINEQIALRRGILLLSLDDRAFDQKDLAYIEKATVLLE